MIVIYNTISNSEYPIRAISCLCESGSLGKEDLAPLFKNIFGTDRVYGNFLNLEELNKFVYNVALESRIDEISVVTKEDYNEKVKDVGNVATFFSDIFEVGDKLQNMEKIEGSSFIDRFFN